VDRRSSPAVHQAVHHHPRLTGNFSTTSHRRDVDRADQSLPIRQEGFHTTRPAVDQNYITKIKSSPDCTTKYIYVCVCVCVLL